MVMDLKTALKFLQRICIVQGNYTIELRYGLCAVEAGTSTIKGVQDHSPGK